MFGPLGVPELLFILVLALLIFGPKRLPEIGRTIGRGMAEFRKASNDLKRSIHSELALDEPPTAPLPALRTPMAAPARTAARGSHPHAVPEEALDPSEPEDVPEPPSFADSEIPVNEPLEPR